MERESDCKIAIRGKGSVKEGARRGPTVIDEDDELHVYISGETEEAVEKVPLRRRRDQFRLVDYVSDKQYASKCANMVCSFFLPKFERLL